MVATVLHRIEAVVFFLAMMLAVVLEGGIVYWLSQHPASQGASFGLTGQWTGAALPQAWLFGINADLSPEDPMAAARRASCNACLDDFLRREQCYRASAGHPNLTGAQKFADAILAALA